MGFIDAPRKILMRPFGRIIFLLVHCSVALIAAPVDDNTRFEAWSKWARSQLDRPSYFLDREVLIALPVTPPAANSSPATRADLDELLRLQQERTREQLTVIKNHREYDGVCASVLGAAHLNLAHAPSTKALLEHIEMDASLAVF